MQEPTSGTIPVVHALAPTGAVLEVHYPGPGVPVHMRDGNQLLSSLFHEVTSHSPLPYW